MKRDFTKVSRGFAYVAGIFSLIIGLAVLAGWILDIEILKSAGPNFISMKVNTAICFLLLGAATLVSVKYRKNREASIFAGVCALIVMAIAGLSLAEYVFGWNLGLDELFFKDMSVVSSAFPGRMAIITALDFFLLSLVLFRNKTNDLLNDSFLVFVFFSSLFYFNEYIFQDPILYHSTGVIPLAINTSITLIILSLGVKLINPESGITRIFTMNDLGGEAARKIVPAVILLPTIIAWVETVIEKFLNASEFYVHSAIGVANSFIIGMLVLYTAYLISGSESGRIKDIELREKAEMDLKFAMAEVKEKNLELERLNKIFIDRELKMADYKREMSKKQPIGGGE